jgi:hypothetical protein
MNLRVGAIARQSYGAVLGRPRALVRCAAMPAAVWIAGNALLCTLEGSFASGPQPVPLASLVLEWGPGLSFAIAWLRWILLGERRPALAAPRFGRRELAAFVLSIVLPLATVAPLAVPLAVGVVLRSGQDAGLVVNAVVTVLVAAAALWALVLTLRMMLVFPLVALDAGLAAPLRAWRATRGRMLALLGLLIATAGPPTAVEALAPLVLDDAPGVSAWGALLLDVVLYFPASAIALTAGALAARALGAVSAAAGQGAAEPAAPATAS